MTIDQIISLAASVAACLTAVAALLTIWQISKQRKASYHPELALSTVSFEASGSDVGQPILPLHWIRRDEDAKPEEKFFSITLNNIGLGSAKDLKILWRFDFEAVVEELNRDAQKALIPAHYIFENDALSLRSQSLGQTTSLWRNQRSVLIDYVLPASVQARGPLLVVPNAYQLAVSSVMYIWAQNLERRQEVPEIPTLHMHAQYLDIGNISHSAHFEIQMELTMVKGAGESFAGYLKPKRMR